ncbi:ankyrin repeat-containing domain protein [Echria macrotheca]|uniref:Ankyrin repeat-containing domain protein n=1 Tax=Echria macrotheca TaxID=438768 RepID=A0AAJ0B5N9_9PEZI|nr:ankyrin repeat-containing domain protein [Echria macrotheca]
MRLWKRSLVNAVDKSGRTPLAYAVWSGNTNAVEILVTADAEPDLKDNVGGSPLSYAICTGREVMVNLLLKGKGKHQSEEDVIMKELFFSAAARGDEQVIRLLLDTDRLDISARDETSGHTALSLAITKSQWRVAHMLLTTGKLDLEGEKLLLEAIEKFERNVVAKLLGTGRFSTLIKEKILSAAEDDNNLDLDMRFFGNMKEIHGEARDLLLSAVKKGNKSVVRMLLANDVCPEAEAREVLVSLLEEGDTEAISIILGSETTEIDVEHLIISSLEKLPKVPILKLLQTDSIGASLRRLLVWAAEDGDEALARWLLTTDRIDIDQWLLQAARGGQKSLIPKLVHLGAEVEGRDINYRPLIAAIDAESNDGVLGLFEAGAAVDYTFAAPLTTPLLRAIEMGNYEIVSTLLQHGANPAFMAGSISPRSAARYKDKKIFSLIQSARESRHQ